MNTNDPKFSTDPDFHQKSSEEKAEESILPIVPPAASPSEPISSPTEPTRAYPADPSLTYSSNPSQYSYPHSPNENNPSEFNEDHPSKTHHTYDELKDSKTGFQKEREKLKQKAENFENKARDTFRHMRDSKKVNDIYDYAASNKEQVVTYFLLGMGLIFLLLFNNLIGGLIIGMVAGYYFDSEIIYYLRNIDHIIKGHDQLQYVVFTALLLGLFIGAPGIFIGATIVAAFKTVIAKPQ